MRKLAVISLLAFVAACVDEAPVAPPGADQVLADKGGNPHNPDKGGGGGGKDEGDYTVIDLLPEGASSYAWDIDERTTRQVAGHSQLAEGGASVATVWTLTAEGDAAESYQQLEMPNDYILSRANAINPGLAVNAPVYIVGSATIDYQTSDPFRWDGVGSSSIQLGLSTGSTKYTSGSASDVNDDGIAVGWVSHEPGDPFHAALWDADGQLTTLAGPDSHAGSVNNAGHVVGDVADADGIGHAVLWLPASGGSYKTCDLRDLPEWSSRAMAVSEEFTSNGVSRVYVLGWRVPAPGEREATVWSVEFTSGRSECPESTEPSVLAGPYYDMADINTNAEAVGRYLLGGSSPAVLWTSDGQMVELPALKGSTASAQAVTEAGDRIVGSSRARKGHDRHAVLWTKKSQ